MQKDKCKHIPLSLPTRELKSLSKIPKGNFSIKETTSEEMRSDLLLELSFNDHVVDGSPWLRLTRHSATSKPAA